MKESTVAIHTIGDNEAKSYRLARYPNGSVVLQGLFVSTTYEGTLPVHAESKWIDIPTILLDQE